MPDVTFLDKWIGPNRSQYIQDDLSIFDFLIFQLQQSLAFSAARECIGVA